MTAEDSPADDRVCLILQAAQDLESPNPDAVAGNNLTAGTSRAVSSVKRKNGCSSQERGAEIDKGGTSMLATFHHEEISGTYIIMLIILQQAIYRCVVYHVPHDVK